ncbi:MAG: hypothetical protein GY699_10770 [Desulfobacteraceae bacterium]|nr:hypothetical protein [Desulfobacteraceae bacterium]
MVLPTNILRSLSVGIIFLFAVLNADAQNISIQSISQWPAIYAGKESMYHLKISGQTAISGSFSWTLKVKERVLKKGHDKFYLNDHGEHVISLSLKTPSMKPGVQIPATLNISCHVKQTSQNYTFQFPLTIFSQNGLLDNGEYLKKLKILLFDPIGTTSNTFQNIKIPHTTISKKELWNLSDPKFIVLGSGIVFDQYNLSSRIIELAQKGSRILLFEPSSGNFSMAEFSKGLRPNVLAFADHHIIKSFSKPFRWIDNDPKQQYGLTLVRYRNSIMVQVVENKQKEWDWLYVNYAQSNGKIILCTIPIIEYVNDSPVAQIIMKQLLLYINTPLDGGIKTPGD